MPVETEEKILEEEARLQKEEERELRRIQLEEARTKQTERERAEQEKINATQEEALREDKERSYNKSLRGRIANKLGKGKYQKPKDEEEKQAKGKGGSPIVIQENINTGRQRDTPTIVMVILVFLIWILDRLPILGGPYVGFNFDIFGFQRVDMVAVGTSTLVIILLIINMITGILEKKLSFLISFALINLIFIIWKTPYYYDVPYGNIIFLIFLAACIYFVFKHHESLGDYSTYLFLTLVFSFFWINWGWYDIFKARIHMFFILLFGFFYMSAKEKDNTMAWHVLTPLLIFVDFYGYSLTAKLPLFSHIPILAIFVLFYCYWKTRSNFAMISFIILVFIVIFLNAPEALGAENPVATLPFIAAEGGASATQTISKIWSGFIQSTVGATESRLDYATGGYYKSQVEKNQFEPLGVYLDKVRAAQPRFFTNEPVTIWGTIKSKTLSDPVIVAFDCNWWKDDNKVYRQSDDSVTPKKPFLVYGLDEKDVECIFNKKFQAGSTRVTLSANYNFATSAYKKVYFIDNDRFRSLTRENLDPFMQFGITDTKPGTVYTNGPVELDVTLQNLIRVSSDPDNVDVQPLLGVTLRNRDKITDKNGKAVGQWSGKIKQIKELDILLPDSIELDKNTCQPQPVKFEDFTLDDCDISCRDVCKNACNIYDLNTAYNKCINKCDDKSISSESTKKCNEECTSLFKPDKGNINYKGYRITDADIYTSAVSKDYKNIDRYKDFGCRITPKPGVLENVPITTKFIRVRARYDYLLENNFMVSVVQPPQLPEEQALLADIYSTIPEATLRNLMFTASENEKKYSDMVLEKSKENNVDYLLIKAIIQEENKYWNAKDAHTDTNGQMVYGLMQVTEGTGGPICNTEFPNWRTDAEDNIKCGIKVLKSKCNDFKPACNAPLPQCIKDSDCIHPSKGNLCSGKPCNSFCRNSLCSYEFTGSSKPSGTVYSNWGAAVRAYNGWGAGNDNYADRVYNNYQILSKQVQSAPSS